MANRSIVKLLVLGFALPMMLLAPAHTAVAAPITFEVSGLFATNGELLPVSGAMVLETNFLYYYGASPNWQWDTIYAFAIPTFSLSIGSGTFAGTGELHILEYGGFPDTFNLYLSGRGDWSYWHVSDAAYPYGGPAPGAFQRTVLSRFTQPEPFDMRFMGGTFLDSAGQSAGSGGYLTLLPRSVSAAVPEPSTLLLLGTGLLILRATRICWPRRT